MRTVLTLALGVALLPATGSSDEVRLRGGGRLTGIVVHEDGRTVELEVGPGRLTLPAARVESITRSRSSLAVFHERAARLDADDVEGWRQLGLWARDAGLPTQARLAFERVVALSPSDALAQQALGRVSVDGRWLSSDEAYRARGYVLFEGRWVTPAEQAAELAERAADRAEAADRREAEARVRQAEARARQAEALASRAQDPPDTGIPLGLGGYGYGWGGSGRWASWERPQSPRPPAVSRPTAPRPAPPPPVHRTLPATAAGMAPRQH